MKYFSLIFTFFFLLLTGCSKPATGRGTKDACILLTKESAEQALGTSFTNTQSQRFGENPRQKVISNCLYVANTPEQIKSLSFTIRVNDAAQPNPADTMISTMKQEFGERYELKKLEGLGDGAVWDNSLKQLTVFRGPSTFVLAAPGATVPELEDKLVALAKKTIGSS